MQNAQGTAVPDLSRNEMAKPICPDPIDSEQRICFGIMWFATEADAQAAHRYVRYRNIRYNGGMFDGMPCGRDETWDQKDADGNTIAFGVTC